MHHIPLRALLPILVTTAAMAAEWQWSTEVDSVISKETKAPPRAFLWIPPDCAQVRAVVVGQHNMEEEPILEHPDFRATLARLGIAEIWITPGIDLQFRFDRGADEHFDAMMRAFAGISGYAELTRAPVVPIGHSAAASYPWNFAALHPERTLAVLSISGQWPYYRDDNTPPWGDRTVDGIPGLVTMGEYEWAEQNAAKGLAQRVEHPRTPLSMLACPADGHFNVTDEKVAFLALYLRKAVEHRLPAEPEADGSVRLKPIDPTRDGWLVDRWRPNQGPQSPAAPVGSYAGDRAQAFWFFDGELARAAERFGAENRGKKAQLLGYVQDGAVVPQVNGTHQQVNLAWKPLADGISFHLSGAFLDTVPTGRPERWSGLPAGSPISHGSDSSAITVQRICGPVERTGPDTWAIAFDRMGMDNPRRSNEIWFAARHPGDAVYKSSVQQAVLHFPRSNQRGAAQHISFPELPDIAIGTTEVPLAATSDAGVPVHYYVLAGPAELAGDRLRLTRIPPRSAYPVAVTVVAWQWGRSIEPQLRTAEPVTRTFRITKP